MNQLSNATNVIHNTYAGINDCRIKYSRRWAETYTGRANFDDQDMGNHQMA